MTLKFRDFKLQEPGYLSGRKVCKSPSVQPGTSSSGDISFKKNFSDCKHAGENSQLRPLYC